MEAALLTCKLFNKAALKARLNYDYAQLLAIDDKIDYSIPELEHSKNVFVPTGAYAHYLVVEDNQQQLHAIDMMTRTRSKMFKPEQGDSIRHAAFTPMGDKVLLESEKGYLYLWNIQADSLKRWQARKRLRGGVENILSPDEKHLLISYPCQNRSTDHYDLLSVIDILTGNALYRPLNAGQYNENKLSEPLPDQYYFSKQFQLTPNGRYIVGVNQSEHSIIIWEKDTGKLFNTINIQSLDFSYFCMVVTNQSIFTIGTTSLTFSNYIKATSHLTKWNIQSGKCLTNFDFTTLNLSARFYQFHPTLDGRHLIRFNPDEGHLSVWDCKSGEKQRSWPLFDSVGGSLVNHMQLFALPDGQFAIYMHKPDEGKHYLYPIKFAELKPTQAYEQAQEHAHPTPTIRR